MESDKPATLEPNYSALKEDPIYLLTLVDKYVRIQMIKNTSYEGFVHSIDPLSYSIFLAVPKEDGFQTILIPGHGIIDLTEQSTQLKPPSYEEYFPGFNKISSDKKKLVSWFKLNLLPVSEVDNNIIVGSVNILPPYSVMDIYAGNPVVALQIRKLMETMPRL